MKVLLDTHIWLWWVLEPARLGPQAQATIANPGNQVFISAVSTWEVVIKFALGRLELPGGPSRFFQDSLANDGFDALSVTPQHTLGVSDLPDIHKDPFDRLLVAQAIVEGAALISSDSWFRDYPIRLLRGQD